MAVPVKPSVGPAPTRDLALARWSVLWGCKAWAAPDGGEARHRAGRPRTPSGPRSGRKALAMGAWLGPPWRARSPHRWAGHGLGTRQWQQGRRCAVACRAGMAHVASGQAGDRQVPRPASWGCASRAAPKPPRVAGGSAGLVLPGRHSRGCRMGVSCFLSLPLFHGPGSQPGQLLPAAGRRRTDYRGRPALALMASAQCACPCSARLPLLRHQCPSEGGCQGHPAEGRTPDTVPCTPGLKAGSLSPKGQSPSLSKVCFHGICESCMCFSGRLRHPRRGTPAFWTGGSSRRHPSLLARAPGKRKPPARQLRPSLAHAGERKPGPLPHATSSGAVFRNTI